MEKPEYERLQAGLTALMSDDKRKLKHLNSKEWDAYKLAVKACKSVLSSYRPGD